MVKQLVVAEETGGNVNVSPAVPDTILPTRSCQKAWYTETYIIGPPCSERLLWQLMRRSVSCGSRQRYGNKLALDIFSVYEADCGQVATQQGNALQGRTISRAQRTIRTRKVFAKKTEQKIGAPKGLWTEPAADRISLNRVTRGLSVVAVKRQLPPLPRSALKTRNITKPSSPTDHISHIPHGASHVPAYRRCACAWTFVHALYRSKRPDLRE